MAIHDHVRVHVNACVRVHVHVHASETLSQSKDHVEQALGSSLSYVIYYEAWAATQVKNRMRISEFSKRSTGACTVD